MGLNALQPNDFEQHKPEFGKLFFAVLSHGQKLRKEHSWMYTPFKDRYGYSEFYNNFLKNGDEDKRALYQELIKLFSPDTIKVHVQAFHRIYRLWINAYEGDAANKLLIKHAYKTESGSTAYEYSYKNDASNEKFKFKSVASARAYGVMSAINQALYTNTASVDTILKTHVNFITDRVPKAQNIVINTEDELSTLFVHPSSVPSSPPAPSFGGLNISQAEANFTSVSPVEAGVREARNEDGDQVVVGLSGRPQELLIDDDRIKVDEFATRAGIELDQLLQLCGEYKVAIENDKIDFEDARWLGNIIGIKIKKKDA